jgi:hypothetical protein
MSLEQIPIDELTVERATELTGTGWVDATGEVGVVSGESLADVGREIARWTDEIRSRGKNAPSIFNRQAYVAPDNPYSQMQIAKNAVENDDVVGGVADVTEGLIFQGIKWEAEESDDADIFNQVNRDLNMDDVARTWHRMMFTYSQAIVGYWWGRRTYTVRGHNLTEVPREKQVDPATGVETWVDPIDPETGRPVKPKKTKRRKKVNVICPVALTFLDPRRVVPMPPGPFGQQRLAWHATTDEMFGYEAMLEGLADDAVMSEFFNGKVTGLSKSEQDLLGSWGIDPKRLIWLNPYLVKRYTRTMATYERFPENRLRSIFPLLDLKQQLMEADRVSLVGAANYILLVKKGDKDDPAKTPELENLKENFQVIAKLPVIIGDHRLNIEIITPDQSHVLESAKYDTIDKRVLNRCLGALTATSSGQRNESTLTVARGVARLLEGQRHTLKRAFESDIARAMIDLNPTAFEDEPNLAFMPRNVQLDQDSQIVQALMALRTQKEISRETILEFFNLDQAVEAQRREFEQESGLDTIFGTAVPFSSPENNMGPNGTPVAPAVSGATGGRPAGGGATKKSPQRQAKPKTSSGNPSTKKES